MNDSFWAGGASAYAKVLSKEHKSIVKALNKRMKATANPSERESLQAEIKQAGLNYEAKLEQIDESLF